MPEADDTRKQYEVLKKKLKESITKRNQLEDQLTKQEEEIYTKETKYLSDGALHGNIVKGFENYSKTNTSSSSRSKKLQFTDQDRIFSLSSSTYVMHLRHSQSTGLTMSTPSLEGDEDFSATPTPKKRK